MAFQADRERVRPPAPFESWFELDVFLRIARYGYRVIPQFEIGGYRIDLVVQGMDGSLAVECDGDAWHGADRYDEDAARQRDLERCGWTFWRVRESTFRLDPDEALNDLWETLKTHRIVPTVREEMCRGETKQGAVTPAVQEVLGDSLAADDSIGAQERGGAGTSDGEIDPELPSDHLLAKRSDVQPTNQTAGPGGVPQFSDPSGAPEQLSHREGSVPLQPPLQLSRREPAAVNADQVGGLAPYVEWTSTGSVPDPRTARQGQLTALLAEVAEREGPVVAIRAYRLINRASGSKRLTTPARRALNRACATAVRTGQVVAANPLDREGQAQLVLRSPERPEVILRERGPRELDELPPDEIATMLRSVYEAIGPADEELLKRQALERLGWVRLTRNVSEFLDQCIALM